MSQASISEDEMMPANYKAGMIRHINPLFKTLTESEIIEYADPKTIVQREIDKVKLKTPLDHTEVIYQQGYINALLRIKTLL